MKSESGFSFAMASKPFKGKLFVNVWSLSSSIYRSDIRREKILCFEVFAKSFSRQGRRRTIQQPPPLSEHDDDDGEDDGDNVGEHNDDKDDDKITFLLSSVGDQNWF